MSSLTVPHYEPAPTTNEALDYADLAVVDFSKFGTPEGRAQLALQVREAMAAHGFFCVINHGYSTEQMNRVFGVADVAFSQVSEVEKKKYAAPIRETGFYQGYKARQYWYIDGGIWDSIEFYNIHHDVTRRGHPEALRPFIPEIDQFARHSHLHILDRILRLMALGLELPEDTLVNLHKWGDSDSHIRYMKYYPRSAEEEEKSRSVMLKGHTDTSTISILYSQPISGLQIQGPDGNWKWVKHVENGLIVNAGDSMDFLSGGLYPATVHRVVSSPPDQRQYTRLGVFYFAFADDDVKLAPLVASPVLQRVGIKRRFEKDEDAPLMKNYRLSRSATYAQTVHPRKEVEEELIEGVVVKFYN